MNFEDLVSGKVRLIFGDAEQLKVIKDYAKDQQRLASICQTCDGEGQIVCEDCGGSGNK